MTVTQSPSTQQSTSAEPPSWTLKLLYDGDCPLCLREVNFLQRQDAGRQRVVFVDIAADDYNPAENGGIDFETAMGRIHAIRADGSVICNVEVFRQVYDALGMGWVYAMTRWPGIRPLVEAVYGVWAEYRLRMTGRPPLKEIVAARHQRLGCGPSDRCRLGDEEGQ